VKSLSRYSSTAESVLLIERFCCCTDLATYDPYDIWKTSLGFLVKDLFNRNRAAGFVPAAGLTLFDVFLNGSARFFYNRQEYPIVRALAALSLLNLYRSGGKRAHLEFARQHLQWLAEHGCQGYAGACWGLGFHYPVSPTIIYDANTPFCTITPYVLDAFVEYKKVTGDGEYSSLVGSIHDFFDRDIRVMQETDDWMATSYGPRPDRIVSNAISYVMYSYAQLLPYLTGEAREKALLRIGKLYAFLRLNQQPDGSWFYSPEGRSFIDCFHTCIVLKNIVKTSRLVDLPDSTAIVTRGYGYMKEKMYDARRGLFRRFSLSNKPSLVKYDLYDNAEVLGLAVLLGDDQLVASLSRAIDQTFHRGLDVYSQIDGLGVRRNKNMLRWAVMPYLYTLSEIAGHHVA
jgi:hypothetical protein